LKNKVTKVAEVSLKYKTSIKPSERNLEIIGEAINRILKEDPAFHI